MDTNVEADRTASGSDRSGRGIQPWTIKGVPPEVRYAAVEASRREKQPQGEWVARAIRLLLQHDRQQNRLPVLVSQPVRPSDPEAGLAEIERLVGVMRDDPHDAPAAPPPPETAPLTVRPAVPSLVRHLSGGQPFCWCARCLGRQGHYADAVGS